MRRFGRGRNARRPVESRAGGGRHLLSGGGRDRHSRARRRRRPRGPRPRGRCPAEAVGAATAGAVADLREVTFLGSTGARLLLEAGEDARRKGVGFAIRLGASPVRRVIELLGAGVRLQIMDPGRDGGARVHIDPLALARGVEGLGRLTEAPTLEEALERVVRATEQLFDLAGGADARRRGRGAELRRGDRPGAQLLETAQEETGEGPCVDAFVLSEIVRTADIGSDDRYRRGATMVAPTGCAPSWACPRASAGPPSAR